MHIWNASGMVGIGETPHVICKQRFVPQIFTVVAVVGVRVNTTTRHSTTKSTAGLFLPPSRHVYCTCVYHPDSAESKVYGAFLWFGATMNGGTQSGDDVLMICLSRPCHSVQSGAVKVTRTVKRDPGKCRKLSYGIRLA